MTIQELRQQAAQLSQPDRKALRDYLDNTLDEGDVLDERDQFRRLLGDALVRFDNPPPTLSDDEEQALMQMLDEEFRGQPPLSDEIIAERQGKL